MRLHAYVLAGDPAWVAESIRSYYEVVDRIVVSYDQAGLSWAGIPLSVEESLRRLEQVDPDRKMVLLPGDHVDPTRHAMHVETTQRQSALDAASEGADWVVQLDTDEIVPRLAVFQRVIRDAHEHGAHAVEFPARVLYTRTPRGRFLENCSRLWGDQANYPGPVAVRAGTTLSFARQAASAPLYRADLAPWSTDPSHPQDAPVHQVLSRDEAILHMSWVRTSAQMNEKACVSGHASERNWPRELSGWNRRSRHPWASILATPITKDPARRFRMASLGEYAGTVL